MKLSFLLGDYFDDEACDIDVSGLCYKANECTDNDVLFLYNEKAIDDYYTKMPKSKAIVSYKRIEPIYDIPVILVKNIRGALSYAFCKLYCKDISQIKFIGITGTNGKSTTAIILKEILINHGYKVGLIGTGKIMFGNTVLSSENYSMTTPPPDVLYPTIAQMEDMGVQIIIMEVSSHALDQDRVLPIDYYIGIFTNLSEEHLDYHRSMEEYFISKIRLFEKSRYVIANTDDLYGKRLMGMYPSLESCGVKSNACSKANNLIDGGFSGTEFTYQSKNSVFNVHIKIPGKYNVYNALLAIKAAEILKVPENTIKDAFEIIPQIDGRFNVLHDVIDVVVDYAHTARAFYVLLKSLFSYKKQEQNLIVVFGCGGNRDKSKRCTMGLIAERYSDVIVLTSDNPRDEDPESIIDEISNGMTKEPIKIVDREKAIRAAIKLANPGDIVAVIGKGSEKYVIKDGKYTSFDEKSIIKSALQERS